MQLKLYNELKMYPMCWTMSSRCGSSLSSQTLLLFTFLMLNAMCNVLCFGFVQ